MPHLLPFVGGAFRDAGVRAFVTDEWSWARTAERQVEALSLFPSPRLAEKRLLFDRIREGVRDRAVR